VGGVVIDDILTAIGFLWLPIIWCVAVLALEAWERRALDMPPDPWDTPRQQ
jgi:hypothetical protein